MPKPDRYRHGQPPLLSEREFSPPTGTGFYYSPDHLGSVRDVLNTQTDVVVASVDYDAYSQIIQSAGTIPTESPRFLSASNFLIYCATCLVSELFTGAKNVVSFEYTRMSQSNETVYLSQ